MSLRKPTTSSGRFVNRSGVPNPLSHRIQKTLYASILHVHNQRLALSQIVSDIDLKRLQTSQTSCLRRVCFRPGFCNYNGLSPARTFAPLRLFRCRKVLPCCVSDFEVKEALKVRCGQKDTQTGANVRLNSLRKQRRRNAGAPKKEEKGKN